MFILKMRLCVLIDASCLPVASLPTWTGVSCFRDTHSHIWIPAMLCMWVSLILLYKLDQFMMKTLLLTGTGFYDQTLLFLLVPRLLLMVWSSKFFVAGAYKELITQNCYLNLSSWDSFKTFGIYKQMHGVPSNMFLVLRKVLLAKLK